MEVGGNIEIGQNNEEVESVVILFEVFETTFFDPKSHYMIH